MANLAQEHKETSSGSFQNDQMVWIVWICVPHERPHAIMTILGSICMPLPDALKYLRMRAIKDIMALVAHCTGGITCSKCKCLGTLEITWPILTCKEWAPKKNNMKQNSERLAQPSVIEAKSHLDWPSRGLSRETPDLSKQACKGK